MMRKIFSLFIASLMALPPLFYTSSAEAALGERSLRRYLITRTEEGAEKAWDAFERLSDGTLLFLTSIGETKYQRFSDRYVARQSGETPDEVQARLQNQPIYKKDLTYFAPVGVDELKGDPVTMRVTLGAKGELNQVRIFDTSENKIILDFTTDLSLADREKVQLGEEPRLFQHQRRLSETVGRLGTEEEIEEPPREGEPGQPGRVPSPARVGQPSVSLPGRPSEPGIPPRRDPGIPPRRTPGTASQPGQPSQPGIPLPGQPGLRVPGSPGTPGTIVDQEEWKVLRFYGVDIRVRRSELGSLNVFVGGVQIINRGRFMQPNPDYDPNQPISPENPLYVPSTLLICQDLVSRDQFLDVNEHFGWHQAGHPNGIEMPRGDITISVGNPDTAPKVLIPRGNVEQPGGMRKYLVIVGYKPSPNGPVPIFKFEQTAENASFDPNTPEGMNAAWEANIETRIRQIQETEGLTREEAVDRAFEEQRQLVEQHNARREARRRQREEWKRQKEEEAQDEYARGFESEDQPLGIRRGREMGFEPPKDTGLGIKAKGPRSGETDKPQVFNIQNAAKEGRTPPRADSTSKGVRREDTSEIDSGLKQFGISRDTGQTLGEGEFRAVTTEAGTTVEDESDDEAALDKEAQDRETFNQLLESIEPELGSFVDSGFEVISRWMFGSGWTDEEFTLYMLAMDARQKGDYTSAINYLNEMGKLVDERRRGLSDEEAVSDYFGGLTGEEGAAVLTGLDEIPEGTELPTTNQILINATVYAMSLGQVFNSTGLEYFYQDIGTGTNGGTIVAGIPNIPTVNDADYVMDNPAYFDPVLGEFRDFNKTFLNDTHLSFYSDVTRQVTGIDFVNTDDFEFGNIVKKEVHPVTLTPPGPFVVGLIEVKYLDKLLGINMFVEIGNTGKNLVADRAEAERIINIIQPGYLPFVLNEISAVESSLAFPPLRFNQHSEVEVETTEIQNFQKVLFRLGLDGSLRAQFQDSDFELQNGDKISGNELNLFITPSITFDFQD